MIIYIKTRQSKAVSKKSPDHYFGYLAVCFGKVFPLSFLQELGPSSDGQYDAVCHSVVMQTELHGSLKVSSEQGLCDQAIYIWKKYKQKTLYNYKIQQSDMGFYS